jgi:hypothetical protein
MKRGIKYFIRLTVLLVCIAISYTYGYFTHRNKLFPYEQIRTYFLKQNIKKTSQWSIGIFRGPTPFDLKNTIEANKPVITAKDVDDIDAAFVADPFIVMHSDIYYMFFEIFNLESEQGDIGYAISNDGIDWQYKGVVLDEDFHLSYPAIYEIKGEYYMIPESSEANAIRLYKSVNYPDNWAYVGDILSGAPFTDPTLFFHRDHWWMFTSESGNNGILNLHYTDSLFHGWQPHPYNPIIENNYDFARPAGKVFCVNDKIYRLAQDDTPYYGMQVYAVEIADLTPTSYSEILDSAKLIISYSNKGWNKEGMHHAHLIKIGDSWLASVDGIKRR